MEEKDIFKTETIYDEMVHTAYTNGYTFSQPGFIWSHLVFIAALLFMLANFSIDSLLFRFLFWSAIYLVVIFLWLPRRLKINYRKILDGNQGQQPHNRFHLRPEGIQAVNPKTGNEVFHPYSSITQIVDTPKLVLLVMGKKQCVILQKCWLLGGTPGELIAFLKKECPQVRRIRGIGLGQWLRRIMVTIMIAGSVIGLILLSLSPTQAEASKTYAEVAADLAPLGITISDETIDEVESFYAEYSLDLETADKAQALLCMEGMGDYDMETLEWTPSESGVYWMDAEVFFVDSIYTDFLAGLSAMDAELDFSNVQEDYSKVDMESGVGTLPVSFDFRGQHYELDARYNYDWFDSDVLYEIVRIVNFGGGDKKLYYAFDGGQGFLFYYGTAENVRALKQLTELPFTSSKSLISRFYF